MLFSPSRPTRRNAPSPSFVLGVCGRAAEWRALARRGWVGVKVGLFDHPATTGDAPLEVVIEEELVGMRSEPHGIDFLAPLVADPCLDQIFRKYAAFQQELVI